MKPGFQEIEAVNDFVIKFANVNGSGSASANELFAKAVLRMGVPVSPRNIFPSNIQGLPTWYEARVCEAGYAGRRGGVDMMVAMNPQTWAADVAEIEPGGYLLYDSTRPIPQDSLRKDVRAIPVPLTDIANRLTEEGIRTRQRIFKRRGGQRVTVGGTAIKSDWLRHLIKNPIYSGRVRLKGHAYSGQHEAIVSAETWCHRPGKTSQHGPGQNQPL